MIRIDKIVLDNVLSYDKLLLYQSIRDTKMITSIPHFGYLDMLEAAKSITIYLARLNGYDVEVFHDCIYISKP